MIKPTTDPLFRESWSGTEELQLLVEIRCHGLGNWDEVAQAMQGRTAAELEAHYRRTYIRSPMAPLPRRIVQPRLRPPAPPPYDTHPQDSCPSEGHAHNLKMKNKHECTTPAEFSGYMPHRHEFETAFNNEAESLVANLTFSGEDTRESFASKLELLTSYNAQLAERALRTAVIEDLNLQSLEGRGQESHLLGGISPAEKQADETLAVLVPYVGARRTEEVARELHRGIR
jgi:transcriptional adapter 2-alpha